MKPGRTAEFAKIKCLSWAHGGPSNALVAYRKKHVFITVAIEGRY
jgi:hypothetical protein